MLKKLLSEAGALSWTLAGTAVVIITLSGKVQAQAFWISVAALAVHILSVAFTGEKEENSTMEETSEE